jgi:hypothetical protein
MRWYVYLITIPAVAFLYQAALELIGRPIAAVLRLRQDAIERLLAFRNMALPKPRETAISSQEIREYDRAMRNMRDAQLTFAVLGAQLLAFSEAEPAIRRLMALCGLDTVLAGHELIKLSQLYATTNVHGDSLRRSIEDAHDATMAALAISRKRSGDSLIDIRLEPMGLRVAASRRRRRPLSRPRAVVDRAPLGARFGAGPARRFAR